MACGCNLSWGPINEQQLFCTSLWTQCHVLQNFPKSLSLSSFQVLTFMNSRCFILYLVGLSTEVILLIFIESQSYRMIK